MDKKTIKMLAIFMPIWAGIILFCVCMTTFCGASPSITGFAIDSQNRIYVGESNGIEVYENQMHILTINPQTSRSYVFTILEDDTILLSTPTHVYHMDLTGEIMDTWEDNGADTFNRLKNEKYRFTSANGDEYKVKGLLGRTRIVKNGTIVVYRISMLSFIVKILEPLASIGLCVTVVCCMYITFEKKTNKQL